jgi:hypothetical protein
MFPWSTTTTPSEAFADRDLARSEAENEREKTPDGALFRSVLRGGGSCGVKLWMIPVVPLIKLERTCYHHTVTW